MSEKPTHSLTNEEVDHITRTVKAWPPESPPAGTYQKWVVTLVEELERLREVLTRLIDSPHMEIEGYEIAREALEPRRADEPVKP